MKKIFTTLAFLLGIGLHSYAQSDSTDTKSDTASEESFVDKANEFNAFMEKAIVYIPVPIFSISKETGMLFGLTKFNDFRIGVAPDGSDSIVTQPSTVSGLIYATQKKQFKINVETDLMFHNNQHNLKSRVTYSSFPLLYFGVGNDTKKEDAVTVLYERLEFTGSYLYMFKPKFYAGLSYTYSNSFKVEYFDEEETSPIKDNYDVTVNQGLTSGGGLLFIYEGRDNRLNAFKGAYVNVEYDFNTQWLGTEFEYQRLLIDVRKYFTLIDSNKLILATQLVGEFVTNGANIQELPSLGGPKGVRGVYYGRFRDLTSVALNAEFRFPLFWIFGATVFGGMGQVAPNLGNFAFNRNHYTYGGGLRLMISSKNRVNLRLDFGFSGDDNSFVLGFSEAF